MISFYLSNPERQISAICMLVCFRGKRFRRSIGESVRCSKWSAAKRRIRITDSNREDRDINELMGYLEESALKTVAHFKKCTTYAPDASEFWQQFDALRCGGTASKPMSVVDYFSDFISRYETTRSESCVKHYRLAQNIIRRFQEETGTIVHFEDIDIVFYNKLRAWFNSRGYSTNYFGWAIKTIKLVVNEARNVDHLHSCEGVNSKGFVCTSAEIDNVYLTVEELLKMFHLDISEELVKSTFKDTEHWNLQRKVAALKKARDMFLIGAFTGLRYSDFSRIRRSDIDRTITIYADKTDIKSVIPVHWVVREIFERGYDQSTKMWGQNLNEQIKDVARLAGITTPVKLAKSVAGKTVVVKGEKCDFVTTHTARRSFATNAYKAGIPPIAIMKITGHRTER